MPHYALWNENCTYTCGARRDIGLYAAIRIAKQHGMDCRYTEAEEANLVGFVVFRPVPDRGLIFQEYAKHTTRDDLMLAVSALANKLKKAGITNHAQN